MIAFVSSSYQRLASINNYAPETEGTVSFWFSPSLVTAVKNIVALTDNNFRIQQSNTKLFVRICRGSALSGVFVLVAGIRYHAAVSWKPSGANTINTIYVNGGLDATGAAVTTTAAAGPLGIAATPGGSAQWDGSIEDVRLYNRELTLDEIQTIYACQGTDNIVYGLTDRLKMMEKQVGAAASGVGAVVNTASSQNDFTPNANPLYVDSSLKFKRRQ